MAKPAQVTPPHWLSVAGAVLGWILSWFALFEILAIEIVTCTMGSTDAWLLSLVSGLPILFVALVLLHFCRNTASLTRWFSLPHMFLVPLTAVSAARFFWGTTLQGHHLCTILKDLNFDGYPLDWWNKLWAPIIFLALALLVVSIWRYWRAPKEPGT